MLMSASSEFVTLCQEQIALLTQGLGATLSVVYLTQELAEATTGEAKLIPVVVYPDTAVVWFMEDTAPVSTRKSFTVRNALALPKQKLLRPSASQTPNEAEPSLQEEYVLNDNQIVLPLIHEGVMMGLLVTAREDRGWDEKERSEIQRIAQTLAIAIILDQRRAWLEHSLHQQQIIQEKQRDLLDNLLHQFRNPLTALRTFGKLLLKRLRSGDANREVAASIVRESDRLEELLQQFDKVIDLTAGDLAPFKLPDKQVFVEATVQNEPKPPLLLPGSEDKEADFALVDILNPLLVSAKAIAQERKLQLISDIPPNLPLVRANFKTLREVLSNVIDNALKYTPTGGKILIQAGHEKPHFCGIAISDNGPGIPQQDLEHLGERHYRGVQAETEIPGSGLGLAIAKQLIEQMQGEIQVFSPAINSIIKSLDTPGTTFIIWLPIVEG
jgi:signal transduction histidine kinase